MPAFDAQQAETALNAYLSLLKNKGAATSIMARRKHFLRHLVTRLEALADRFLTDDDAGYRRAVDQTIANFPSDQQVEIISTAREFYPFWIGDLKMIAKLNAADALSLDNTQLDLRGSLVDMFARMDADHWEKSAPPCLGTYVEHLKQLGMDNAGLDIRERLLSLLLYIIRHAEQTPLAYRAGVDAMLTLFTKDETRNLFTDMAREFFYYWNGYHQGESSAIANAA
ncbi:hypothetical protein [Chitinimonas sp. BJYL2]|uniref:hypothetical protein n=1 Tax=Chitinimonas sp. BJYL2 TaxID=2976696 RepID=UPI0022B5C46C|nr:hypothetical protein [Chitinimonas sp. BJYL2]